MSLCGYRESGATWTVFLPFDRKEAQRMRHLPANDVLGLKLVGCRLLCL